jgi:hypothetical protein
MADEEGDAVDWGALVKRAKPKARLASEADANADPLTDADSKRRKKEKKAKRASAAAADGSTAEERKKERKRARKDKEKERKASGKADAEQTADGDDASVRPPLFLPRPRPALPCRIMHHPTERLVSSPPPLLRSRVDPFHEAKSCKETGRGAGRCLYARLHGVVPLVVTPVPPALPPHPIHSHLGPAFVPPYVDPTNPSRVSLGEEEAEGVSAG